MFQAAGHGLPEVLVVGQPLEPRAELAGPVVLELVEEQLVPLAGLSSWSCDHLSRTTRTGSVRYRWQTADRVGHHRARPAASRAAPAAARVDRARARRAARRHRPQRAPRRRATPLARLPRQRHPGGRRRLPAGRGDGACRRCCSTTRRRSRPRSRCASRRAAPSPARARPPSARWPSSTRCCPRGCAPRCARCTTRSPPSRAAGSRWTPTPCWCWRAPPATSCASS